jgi:hypothetical protein
VAHDEMWIVVRSGAPYRSKYSKLSCDLRAVHCRSKLGCAPGDFTGIYRYFAIVGCAVDGAKRGLLETLAHVHQLTVKASVFRTHTGGCAHKVVDSV